jgi:hypothetical protein
MHRLLKLLSPLPLMLLCAAAPALAQPTITNITPAYGGGGPNSPTAFTITGTGFTNPYVQKSVRLVDGNNADVIAGVDCTGEARRARRRSSSRIAWHPAPSRRSRYAMVNGVRSFSSFPFIYYGEPTSPTPAGRSRYHADPVCVVAVPDVRWRFPGITSVISTVDLDGTTSTSV